MKTTTDTKPSKTNRVADVTDEQIRALREEAAHAGDVTQVGICSRALGGSAVARSMCARVISEARAMS